MQERSGVYIRQSTGYSAFIPAALPPEPSIDIDFAMQERLSKADRMLGRLDGSIQTLPNADLFVFMYVRKEAVLSSQIEGTQSSLNDVLDAEAKIIAADRPADVGEVLNYVNAMNYGLTRMQTLPLSTRLIREIHTRLLEGVRGKHSSPGEIRTSQNWIGPAGCTLNEAVFVPPPPHELSGILSNLEEFIHSRSHMPLLIKVGLIHAQFETIHPFLDGNGRIGRLLITFLLCEKQMLAKPVLYLSHYFKQRRDDYYRLLQDVRDHGRWEAWLSFFLDGISQVADEATKTARHILLLRERHRTLITDSFGRATGNGLRVLEELYTVPIINVNRAKTITGLSYQASNQLISRFVQAGILAESSGQARNRRFRYAKYIELFSEH